MGHEGSLTVRIKDGTINTSSPLIIGEQNGILNIGTLNFYDGTSKGKTSAISSSLNDIETNSQVVDGQDGAYYTKYLEIITQNQPAPAPAPAPEPTPDSTPEPTPDSTPEPEPTPEQEPTSEPDPTPEQGSNQDSGT